MLRVTQELIDWYKIKDLITQQDLQDIPKALEIAKTSKHPFAVWLSSVSLGWEFVTNSIFFDFLILFGDNEYASFLSAKISDNVTAFKRLAEHGNIHAMWRVCDPFDMPKMQMIADKGERDACYVWGFITKNVKYIEYAAKLGNRHAIAEMSHQFGNKNIQYWEWYCFGLEYGYHSKYVHIDCKSNASPMIRYICGKRILNSQHKSFYISQNFKCRKAVDMWTLIATRMRIYKDLRKLIGEMIWESRNEALYF